jgi:predicted nucleic acid-binding Zn ribbon protein
MDRTTDNHNIIVRECERCGVPESIVALVTRDDVLRCEDCQHAVEEV